MLLKSGRFGNNRSSSIIFGQFATSINRIDCDKPISIHYRTLLIRSIFVGSATESNSEDEEDPDVKEAVRELVPDLATEDDEAHLNLSLDEESSIIAEYRTLLLSAGYDTNSSPLRT